MLDLAGSMTLPQALARTNVLLQTIADRIERLRADEPVKRPLGRVDILMLSNLGNTQRRVPSVEYHIVGALLGGDTSGRGILNVGTYQIPIWITLNQANFLFLREDIQIVVKNDSITWTPPTGTTNWDVVLFGHPRP